MSEERNTRREILKKVLTLGPLAALAGAFGGNGPKPAQAATYNEDVRINGNLAVMPGASPAGPGSVGIGTTSPGTKLSIYDTNTGFNGLQILNSNTYGASPGSSGAQIQLGHIPSDTINSAYIRGYATNAWWYGSAIGFLTEDGQNSFSEKMTIRNGYVGIGTSYPGVSLEVAGLIRATGTGQHELGPGGGGAGNVYLDVKSQLSGTPFLRLYAGTPGINTNGWWVYSPDDGTQTNRRDLRFYNEGDGVAGDILTLKAQNGCVGIRNSNPTYPLDVQGSIHLTGTVEGKAREAYYSG